MIFGQFNEKNLELVNTKALDVDDAFFLATHTEVPLDRLGLKNDLLGSYTEVEFFELFADESNQYEFSLVSGDTGVGKSHLIRWTYLKLLAAPPKKTQLHLIERSGANLQKIILKIIGDLGGDLLEDIKRRLSEGQQKLSVKGQSDTLLDTLATHLAPENFKTEQDIYSGFDEDEHEAVKYCSEMLPTFFRDDVVRKSFIGDGKIVDDLVSLTIGTDKQRRARIKQRKFSADDFELEAKDVDRAGGKCTGNGLDIVGRFFFARRCRQIYQLSFADSCEESGEFGARRFYRSFSRSKKGTQKERRVTHSSD